MSYEIVLEKRARKFIEKQAKPERERIIRAIYHLPEGDVKAMAGHPGVFRLRVGEYRVIFTKEDSVLLITVVDAGNRGQIYSQY